ncbi:unnamed protein product, partial [Porites lobata]
MQLTLSSSECITWFAVTLTVFVAIVTVNLLSIILFIKNRSLRTRAMYLVISLTVADMFVGGFSTFYLFLISLDRMHATIRPFRHRLIKKWVYGVTIAGVWVLSAMVSTATLILERYGKEWPHGLYLWQSYCCLCLFVICVSYSSIVVKFLCGAHPQHHGADNRQRKLTVTLFIMTIVSLLMWLPQGVYSFLFWQSSIMKFISWQVL